MAYDKPEGILRVPLTGDAVSIVRQCFDAALIDKSLLSMAELLEFATPDANSTDKAFGCVLIMYMGGMRLQ